MGGDGSLLARGAQYQLGIKQITAALRETPVQVVLKLMEFNKDKEGQNNQILLDAAYHGDLETFQFILSFGADIHAKLSPSPFFGLGYHATGGLSVSFALSSRKLQYGTHAIHSGEWWRY